MKQYLLSPRVQLFAALLLITGVTLVVFDGVLEGKQINNSAYLYAFEPWFVHRTPDVGNYNYVLSDDMDAMSISYPTRDLIASGQFSFWNRFWQLGIPEFRIDSGWFYPLRILWVLFGIPVGMTIEVVLRFTAGAIFSFLLLELFGVGRLIALVCAIGFAFGSNNIGDYMYGFGPPGLTLPIVFYFLERVIRFGKRRDIIFFTLSLCLLNSHIMVHVNAVLSIWVGFYTVLRLLSERLPILTMKKAGIAILFAPLLFAFALMPTLDFYLNYFNDSYRSGYSAQQLHPGGLLSLYANKFFGDPLLEPQRYVFGTYVNVGIFIGYLCGAFGIALSLFRLVFKPDRIVLIVIPLTAIMAMTIFDFGFESLETFFGSLPLIRYIRPFYQKPIFQFLLMVLGALGLDYFMRLGRQQALQFVCAVLCMLAMHGLGIYYFIEFYNKKGPSQSLIEHFQFISTVHIALFAALLISHPLVRELSGKMIGNIAGFLAMFALIGLTAVESHDAAASWIPYTRAQAFYPRTETTDFVLRKIGNGRVISLDMAAVPGLLYGYSIPVAAGRSLPRKPYLELLRLAYPELHVDHPTQSLFPLYQTDLTSPVWDIANVRLFIATASVDENALKNKYGTAVQIHRFNDGSVIERKGAGHGGYIAAYTAVASSSPEETKELVAKGLNVKHTMVVDSSVPIEAVPSECADKTVKVRNFKIKPDLVTAIIINECPAYFAPSMFVDKGWKAYVDGKQHPISQAYGFMPMIKIQEKGEHRVEFRYFPVGFLYGGITSLISAVIYLLLVFRLGRRNA